MLLPIGATHRILRRYGGIVILAAIAVLLLDACALRRDRALDRQAASQAIASGSLLEGKSGRTERESSLLSDWSGSIRMRWRLYDTSLPADSAGHHPLQAEAIIEAGETEKATLSESHLETGISLSEGEIHSEESHEEQTAEKIEFKRSYSGAIGWGAALLLIATIVAAFIYHVRRRRQTGV